MNHNIEDIENESDPEKRRCSTTRASSVKSATGHDDVDLRARRAKSTTRDKDAIKSKNLRIGTWDVRGLLQTGKHTILEKEIERCDMDVTGISETH